MEAHLETALEKSNFARSGPSVEIRISMSKDETVRRLRKSVLIRFMQLNPLSESAYCSQEGQVQSGQTLKVEDRVFGRYHSLQVLSKQQLYLHHFTVLVLLAADLPIPAGLYMHRHCSVD